MTPELLSIVMPAYNEEAAIERVVLEHVALLRGMADIVPRWEIVVVNDGSTDRTAVLLEELQQRVPALRIASQRNQGICGAVTRGYLEARGSHIYSTGSDGQWPASNFSRMFESLKAGSDLVIGVRLNRREVYGPMRLFVSRSFNLIPRVLFGVPVHDAGSVKLGRREAFRFPLISRSPFFEAERIIRAHRAGMKVAFVPVSFTTRTGGKESGASWKNVRASLRDVARCAFTYGLR
jgi:dolichol-phosphate mannosyltransferase